MTIGFFRIFAILCTAVICGKLISKLKLPAILGWLITGIVFGPYLAEIVTLQITDALWYKIFIKIFECFAGVMIGREIIFKKIASSGKQNYRNYIYSVHRYVFVCYRRILSCIYHYRYPDIFSVYFRRHRIGNSACSRFIYR